MKNGEVRLGRPGTKMAEFGIFDTLILSVKNNSAKAVYIDVLIVEPDGDIRKVFPAEEGYQDHVFQPGEHMILEESPVLIMSSSKNQFLKVFVSEKNFDMKHLEKTFLNVPDFILMEFGVGGKTAVFNLPINTVSDQ